MRHSYRTYRTGGPFSGVVYKLCPKITSKESAFGKKITDDYFLRQTHILHFWYIKTELKDSFCKSNRLCYSSLWTSYNTPTNVHYC